MSGSQKHKWNIPAEKQITWFQEITPARRTEEDQKQFKSTLKKQY